MTANTLNNEAARMMRRSMARDDAASGAPCMPGGGVNDEGDVGNVAVGADAVGTAKADATAAR